MERSRFSKQTLTQYIQTRITNIQNVWGFDPDLGYAQVQAIAVDVMRTNPIDECRGDFAATLAHANRAYGELNVLRRMADEFGLSVELVCDHLKAVPMKADPDYKRYRPQRTVT
jgi:hypothetical protein